MKEKNTFRGLPSLIMGSRFPPRFGIKQNTSCIEYIYFCHKRAYWRNVICYLNTLSYDPSSRCPGWNTMNIVHWSQWHLQLPEPFSGTWWVTSRGALERVTRPTELHGRAHGPGRRQAHGLNGLKLPPSKDEHFFSVLLYLWRCTVHVRHVAFCRRLFHRFDWSNYDSFRDREGIIILVGYSSSGLVQTIHKDLAVQILLRLGWINGSQKLSG